MWVCNWFLSAWCNTAQKHKNQEPSFPIFLSLQTMPNWFTVEFSSDLHSSVPKRLLWSRDQRYTATLKNKDWQGPFTDHRTAHSSCKKKYFSILALLISPYTFPELSFSQIILRESRKHILKIIFHHCHLPENMFMNTKNTL